MSFNKLLLKNNGLAWWY